MGALPTRTCTPKVCKIMAQHLEQKRNKPSVYMLFAPRKKPITQYLFFAACALRGLAVSCRLGLRARLQ